MIGGIFPKASSADSKAWIDLYLQVASSGKEIVVAYKEHDSKRRTHPTFTEGKSYIAEDKKAPCISKLG